MCYRKNFAFGIIYLEFCTWNWLKKKKFDEESMGRGGGEDSGGGGDHQRGAVLPFVGWLAQRGQRELWRGRGKCKQRNKASILEWQTHKLIIMDVRFEHKL